ncbi:unnamed protein product [Acanthoscelides obtectus]|uniref:Uncharacterized protein n=1 Tax=Acanthoscelides obtectus TaxID=200917 RepID=A0A9P0L068_ACAOB|nr:unnamed protein product [Acanthoscelides obtectus]CAK1669133.1 hypothetical protein AOBTE_LOCUS26820 [Acanthoscelides obtectus]
MESMWLAMLMMRCQEEENECYLKRKENRNKICRFGPRFVNFELNCVHMSKKCQCRELSLSDIELIKQKFYDNGKKDKSSQDNKLSQMMDIM